MTKKQRDKVIKELKKVKKADKFAMTDTLPGNCGAMIWYNIAKPNSIHTILCQVRKVIEDMLYGGYNTCICSIKTPTQMNNEQIDKLKSLGWKQTGTNISSRHHQVGNKERLKYFILLLSNKDREEIGTKLLGMNKNQAIDPDGERIDLHGDDFYYDDW